MRRPPARVIFRRIFQDLCDATRCRRSACTGGIFVVRAPEMMLSASHPATGRPAGPVIRAQVAVTVLVAVVSGLAASNLTAALSAMAGGGIGVVATAYMAFSL